MQKLEIRQFLGLINFYRKFIKSFSQISHPLRQLLAKDRPFVWTIECQRAFDELKEKLVIVPVLALPRLDAPFVVRCDASFTGLGFILGQFENVGRERIVSMGSRSLTPAETCYSISELECLALVRAIREFGLYLAQQHFDVYTDHIALKYLQAMKLSTNNRLARWALQLQPFRFTIHYKPGPLKATADALSCAERAPATTPPSPGEVNRKTDVVAATAGAPHAARGHTSAENTPQARQEGVLRCRSSCLPTELKTLQSTAVFKRGLKTVLFHIAYKD